MKNRNKVLIGAAVAGIIAGTLIPTSAFAGKAEEKGECWGAQGCHGHSDCGEMKGKNECGGKTQGFKLMSKKECMKLKNEKKDVEWKAPNKG